MSAFTAQAAPAVGVRQRNAMATVETNGLVSPRTSTQPVLFSCLGRMGIRKTMVYFLMGSIDVVDANAKMIEWKKIRIMPNWRTEHGGRKGMA